MSFMTLFSGAFLEASLIGVYSWQAVPAGHRWSQE